MKVTNIYTLTARDISTDATDKMSSIIKIIDRFHAEIASKDLPDSGTSLQPKPILLPIGYIIGTSWQFDSQLKSAKQLKIRVNLHDPKGVNLGGPEQEHQIPEGVDKINLNFSMQGFPYTKNGAYQFHAELLDDKDTTLAEGTYIVKAEVDIRE
jgi:hypothetical protein